MLRKISLQFIVITFMFIAFYSYCNANETIFYILRNNPSKQQHTTNKAFSSLKQNINNIDILITQAYYINATGNVKGYIDSEVMNLANNHSVKVMALVTNSGFDKNKVKKFLSDFNAQKKAVNELLRLCKQNKFYGIQFDFEMIPADERPALTQFYAYATSRLHKEGYKVSFAIIPSVSDAPHKTAFLKRSYENSGGVYDLKKLGQLADFITIMSYNQHTNGTTPGSSASIRWVNETIKHALRYIPAHKLSLGIPSYSVHWVTDSVASGKITTHVNEIGYDEVKILQQKHGLKFKWDDKNKINYSVYERGWLNEYLFVEDARSLQAKLDKVKQFKLRGISVFTIGMEDPQIWKFIAVANK